MKQLILIALLSLILIGCKEEIEPPFSKEKMQSILIQVHLTDASVSSVFGDLKDSLAEVHLEQVKTINKITDEEIESIFEYLKENPDSAQIIYGNMISELNLLQQEVKKDEVKNENKQKEKDKKRRADRKRTNGSK